MRGAIAYATIARFLEVVDDPASGKVFVHCRHGKDRIGVLVALYRITRQHWNVERAYQEARRFGLSWWHFPAKATLHQFAARIAPTAPAESLAR